MRTSRLGCVERILLGLALVSALGAAVGLCVHLGLAYAGTPATCPTCFEETETLSGKKTAYGPSEGFSTLTTQFTGVWTSLALLCGSVSFVVFVLRGTYSRASWGSRAFSDGSDVRKGQEASFADDGTSPEADLARRAVARTPTAMQFFEYLPREVRALLWGLLFLFQFLAASVCVVTFPMIGETIGVMWCSIWAFWTLAGGSFLVYRVRRARLHAQKKAALAARRSAAAGTTEHPGLTVQFAEDQPLLQSGSNAPAPASGGATARGGTEDRQERRERAKRRKTRDPEKNNFTYGNSRTPSRDTAMRFRRGCAVFTLFVFVVVTMFMASSLTVHTSLLAHKRYLYRDEWGEFVTVNGTELASMPAGLSRPPSWKMRIYCTRLAKRNGTVVLLEADRGAPGLSWMAVQNLLEDQGIASCSYDRSGLGFSETAQVAPRTNDQLAREFREALGQRGVEPPFAVVGHGAGGDISLVFAHKYAAEVVALGLIDSYGPLADSVLAELNGDSMTTVQQHRKSQLSLFDLTRAADPLGLLFGIDDNPADFEPASLQDAFVATFSTNRNFQAQYGEYLAGIDQGIPPSKFVNTVPSWHRPLLVMVASQSYNARCEDMGYSANSQECTDLLERNEAAQNITQVWRDMGWKNNTDFTLCKFPCEPNLIWTHAPLVATHIRALLK